MQTNNINITFTSLTELDVAIVLADLNNPVKKPKFEPVSPPQCEIDESTVAIIVTRLIPLYKANKQKHTSTPTLSIWHAIFKQYSHMFIMFKKTPPNELGYECKKTIAFSEFFCLNMKNNIYVSKELMQYIFIYIFVYEARGGFRNNGKPTVERLLNFVLGFESPFHVDENMDKIMNECLMELDERQHYVKVDKLALSTIPNEITIVRAHMTYHIRALIRLLGNSVIDFAEANKYIQREWFNAFSLINLYPVDDDNFGVLNKVIIKSIVFVDDEKVDRFISNANWEWNVAEFEAMFVEILIKLLSIN